MKLIIEDDEGRKTVVPLVREEITIGRQDGNTIRLTERNVSRRHARLVKDNGSLLIEDLGSYNGVRVNGEKIAGPTKIKEGDLVEIGDYDLGIQGKLDTPMASAPAPAAPPKAATMPPQKPAVAAPKPSAPPPPAPAPAPAAAAPPPAPPPPAPAPAAAAAAPSGQPAGGATAIIRISDIMAAAPQVEARDLDRSEMPRLVGLTGPSRGKEMILMRSEVKFGRTDDNDLSFDHQSVSRQHCKFVLDAGQWKVIDNKSANGVRVNNEAYAISNIKPGDTIELGHLKFRFCAPGEKFTPPPEKSEEKPSTGPKPTTAELIAGASQPGRGVPAGAAKGAAAKKGPPMGLIAGIGGGVVVLLIVVIVMLMKGKGGEESGGDEGGPKGSVGELIKKGDAAFKKHEYLKAKEDYEAAEGKGTVAPNAKKNDIEAKGQEIYEELKGALDSDPDKAKLLYEKCATESTFYCTKAQEMGEQVKGKYCGKHVAAARSALAGGNSAECSNQINLCLGFDPSNADAQGVQCGGQAAAEPAHVKEGPSPAERNAKAAKTAKAAVDKLMARDFPGAIAGCKAALKDDPTDKGALGSAYRACGYGYAYTSDRPNAVKYLEKYLNYCAAAGDCAQVHAYLGIRLRRTPAAAVSWRMDGVQSIR